MKFVDKNLLNNSGFSLSLSMQTKFAEMVTVVAKHLNINPSYLLVQNLYCERIAFKHTGNLNLFYLILVTFGEQLNKRVHISAVSA